MRQLGSSAVAGVVVGLVEGVTGVPAADPRVDESGVRQVLHLGGVGLGVEVAQSSTARGAMAGSTWAATNAACRSAQRAVVRLPGEVGDEHRQIAVRRLDQRVQQGARLGHVGAGQQARPAARGSASG